MIDTTPMLAVSSAVLLAAAAIFGGYARSLPSGPHRYGYAAAVAASAMGLAYLLMALASGLFGAETDVLRFVGYTFMWIAIVLVICAIAGVGRRLTLLLFAAVLGRVWITLGSWFIDGALALVATLGTFAALGLGLYLLFGPFSRAAEALESERRLLFTKLKYLIVLGWVGLVATGLMSEGAGLADDFVGQLVVIYVEMILILGFGGIVVRSRRALSQTASTTRLLSLGTDRESDYSGGEGGSDGPGRPTDRAEHAD
ncbi:bacteriorhodopsin [Natrialba hulunbeirensis]|uniref:bacteriorhodopsin n=1 Tax=Natrialba hulunbeirensis TaxID=123783 RepID=UPI000B275735|nr:bacteriorhodopsin [Natrialba hulunbeirensis]